MEGGGGWAGTIQAQDDRFLCVLTPLRGDESDVAVFIVTLVLKSDGLPDTHTMTEVYKSDGLPDTHTMTEVYKLDGLSDTHHD